MTVTGAQALLETMVSKGVRVCFANPGTSEMHFVNALDRVDGMRPILCLFEGVATGAADGYHRMTGEVPATLLHLGGGLANASSNLHNALKARSAFVNVVGDHATAHWKLNDDLIPSGMDVLQAAIPYSEWARKSANSEQLAADIAHAIRFAARPGGGIATLVVPADCSWEQVESPDLLKVDPTTPSQAAESTIERATDLLRDNDVKVGIILAARALQDDAARTASRIAAATGAALLAPIFNPRVERGAGRVYVETLPFAVPQAIERLAEFDALLLFGADVPVSPFAYPDKPLRTHRLDAEIIEVTDRAGDPVDALNRLADALGAEGEDVVVEELRIPEVEEGPLNAESLATVLARVIPENGIVVDESISVGRQFYAKTRNSRPHDWIKNAGGAIGVGHALALGASIACPDRPVLCVVGDGSAMYMPQALWTQAREGANVVTVILANSTYAILQGELIKMGVSPDVRSGRELLRIDNPHIDFVGLAQSLGVPAVEVSSTTRLVEEIEAAIAAGGPHLIEATLS